MLPTFNMPPIGPRQGKIWGMTQLIFACSNVECHCIQVKKGGFCSRHTHKLKWNRFVLLSGKLSVRVYNENDIVDETFLSPGQITDVPPGFLHEFEALEDSNALEIYWVSLEANDIDRKGSVGGIKE